MEEGCGEWRRGVVSGGECGEWRRGVVSGGGVW